MADISKITLPNGTTYTIKDATARTGSGRVNGTAITVQTGSTKLAKITLQTLMSWLITKGYIPSGTNCYKLLNVSWSYAGNDILQLQAVSATGANTNYELQLAGCQIEFIGNATDYQTGVFRLRIHSSPTTSFTVTSGYTIFPVNHVAEYTCNGSGYTPVWKIHANLGDVVNTNTWRGIQNNLTSDSTTDSLSAAQGKVLASQAIKNITRSGTTFTATRVDGTTFTFTQQDNNTTYTAATAAPLANGTAAVGTSAKYAREDHVHPAQTTISGNAGSATVASRLAGFGSGGAATSCSWGNQTGTAIRVSASPAGGGVFWRDNNPANGQVSMGVDGTLYIKEGSVNVGDAIKSISRSGTTFTYTTLWGNTGTFTQQDTNTHYTTHLYAGSGSAANASTTNGNTKLTVADDSTVRNTVTFKGSGGTTVTSDASGNVTITTEVATVAETKSYLGIS